MRAVKPGRKEPGRKNKGRLGQRPFRIYRSLDLRNRKARYRTRESCSCSGQRFRSPLRSGPQTTSPFPGRPVDSWCRHWPSERISFQPSQPFQKWLWLDPAKPASLRCWNLALMHQAVPACPSRKSAAARWSSNPTGCSPRLEQSRAMPPALVWLVRIVLFSRDPPNAKLTRASARSAKTARCMPMIEASHLKPICISRSDR